MPASGSCIFTCADGYQASLQGMLDLLVPPAREFHARLTWVELPRLRLLRAREASARVAYLSLPSERVFVTFPTRRDSPLIHDGVEVRCGEIMSHGRGARLYQRTTGASRWGSISLTPASLTALGRAVTGLDLLPPSTGLILRPRPVDWTRLLRLHAQAGRIAETKLDHIGHPEVARALEQDLIWALATCLTTGNPQDDPEIRGRHAAMLLRFEEVRASHPDRMLRVPEICHAIGVSERTLRTCCSRVLGMGPGKYQRLRRLKLVCAEIARADGASASIAGVTKRYGFADFRHFVTEYRSICGGPLPCLRVLPGIDEFEARISDFA